METLFQYRRIHPHRQKLDGTGDTLFIDGEKTFIESVLTKQDFAELFGGYLVTTHSDSLRNGSKFKGVWGKDKVKKFKRVLKERGVNFEIVEIDGSNSWVFQTVRYPQYKLPANG